jgi:Zn-dependent protease/predicted transcriptional regulator
MINKISRIRVRLNTGWLIFFLLLVSALSSQFAVEYPHWSRTGHWVVGFSASLLFLGSILLHELSHAGVARILGLPTPKVSFLSFRVSSQLMADVRKPINELLIAGAGPASSFGLSVLFGVAWVLLKRQSETIGALTEWLAQMNLILAFFNLVPGFPLDGGRILRAVLWMFTGNLSRATRITAATGKGAACFFFVGTIALVLLEQFVFALWIGLVGWFLWVSSRQVAQLGRIRDSLEGLTAGDLMVQDCPRVSPRLPLKSFREHILSNLDQDSVLVLDGGLLQGIVTPYEMGKLPQEQWENSFVEDVMIPLAQLRWVGPEHNILRILENMDREEIHHVPVVRQGSLLGVLGRHEIYARLRTQVQQTPN